MAVITITANQTIRQLVDKDDILFLAAGVSIATTAQDGIETGGFDDDNVRLMIEGSVFGADAGIDLIGSTTSVSTGFGNHSVHVGKTGSVTGAGKHGIEMLGQDNELVNDGSIVSLFDGGAALFQNGDDASIQNHGTMSGDFGLLLLGDGDSSDIVNTGVMSGRTAAIRASGQSINLVNTGTITVAKGSGGGEAIDILNGSSSPNYITNTGTIVGDISGALDQSLDLVNSGYINGLVELSNQADMFDGRGGTVNGAVAGLGGDDIYIVDDATITIWESAHGGTDTVRSSVDFRLAEFVEDLTLLGASDLSGTGNFGSNRIIGNDGDNRLNGGSGDDTLLGGVGDDDLRGGRHDDRLTGGEGNDILRGNGGADELNGGDGDDILIGGGGRDRLRGGEDSDVFRFNSAAQTPNTNRANFILDFTKGEDLVDLTRMSTDTLDFIGGAGFSGSGAGELRFTTNGSKTQVRIDVDGDGSADARIVFVGMTSVAESDFLL